MLCVGHHVAAYVWDQHLSPFVWMEILSLEQGSIGSKYYRQLLSRSVAVLCPPASLDPQVHLIITHCVSVQSPRCASAIHIIKVITSKNLVLQYWMQWSLSSSVYLEPRFLGEAYWRFPQMAKWFDPGRIAGCEGADPWGHKSSVKIPCAKYNAVVQRPFAPS